MLAIFDGRVAKRPVCMKMPHKNAMSALDDGFLVNHFTSVYPDSVVLRMESAFTFAYSIGASPSSHLERYRLAHNDDVYCMYQGFIKDIDAVKRDFHISEINDEGLVMIRAFQILRQLCQRIPKKVVEDMSENSICVLYDVTSKLVVLSGGCYHDLPVYWGIDARFNLVISSNETVVERACGSFQAFLSGQVYACCKGLTGQEALFLNKHLPYKVDFTDKYFPIARPVEAVSKMILQAARDMNQPAEQKWEPPLPDFVKINTDATKLRGGKIGFGIVVRDSKGDVIFAASRKEKNILPDLEELQGYMEGFYTAVRFSIQRCICESVHLNLDKMETRSISAYGMVESLVGNLGDEAIKENVSEFSASFVSESANKAAHRLALLAKKEDHKFWKMETPDCIADIIEAERPVIDPVSSAFRELEMRLLISSSLSVLN